MAGFCFFFFVACRNQADKAFSDVRCRRFHKSHDPPLWKIIGEQHPYSLRYLRDLDAVDLNAFILHCRVGIHFTTAAELYPDLLRLLHLEPAVCRLPRGRKHLFFNEFPQHRILNPYDLFPCAVFLLFTRQHYDRAQRFAFPLQHQYLNILNPENTAQGHRTNGKQIFI